MIRDLIEKNRSYRRFYASEPIKSEMLRELVDLARLSASAANRQPLKYILSCEPEKNAIIFKHLAWAGYLKGWGGPVEDERPAAYVIVLGDTKIGKSFDWDSGIAAQSILLGAVEKGFGGCIVASIQKENLRTALDIPPHLKIVLVLALGKPKEKVVIENVGEDGKIEYWRDKNGVHHVPKRSLDKIIVEMP
jgi:nitroreductase